MGRRKQVSKADKEGSPSEETETSVPGGTELSNGSQSTKDSSQNISSKTTVKTPTLQSHSENMELREEFRKLFEKAKQMGLTEEDFAKSKVLKHINWNGSYMQVVTKYILIILCVIVVLYYAFLLNCFLSWPISNETLIRTWFRFYDAEVEHEQCVVYMPEVVADVFRPPVECSFCKGLKKVDIVYNISQDEFESEYAYSGVPVVIGDGTANWTAPKYFSFQYFKEMYKDGSQALENQQKNCQFFPYKTDFQGLGEVLNMSTERADMEDKSKPWYVGWSNCDFAAANKLRKHYQRPYFLPRLSESSKTDWIFMGSPGYGAHLHIDNVEKPSWQAQITGTKRWTLEPPAECYYVCEDQLQITVHPGQIIVLDTNIWFHATLNVGDDISITIGSEYD